MHKPRIGVIGGSGLYQMEGFVEPQAITLTTPFGSPSDAYMLGSLNGAPVAFLSRHGRGHRYNPSEVPYRANLYGFRALGVERIVSVSAVGSLRAEFAPLDLVVPDQFVDRTRGRLSTFFDDGVVAHVAFADPVCAELSAILANAGESVECTIHRDATYICIEGPQFSSRAESNLYRSWDMDIIGMTNATEAKLAREAELCYATLAMVCDYDCWHEGHDDVTTKMVIDILTRSVANAQSVVREAIGQVPRTRSCSCGNTLRNAVLTDPGCISEGDRRKVALLLDPYFEVAQTEGEDA